MADNVTAVTRSSSEYPINLDVLLDNDSPEQIYAVGNPKILNNPTVALFCSSKCPGRLILETYDLAQQLRAEGRTVISGFHSPMEKECLEILLRSPHPIIICPARGIDSMRVPSPWKKALNDERLLILSRFDGAARRATAVLAQKRNIFVAALADQVLIAHAAEGSKLCLLAETIKGWGRNLFTLQNEANANLLAIGAIPFSRKSITSGS